MNINIVDAIDKQLQDEAIAEFESKERDYGHFHPSQWDKCHRQIAYYFYHSKGYIQVDRSSLKNNVNPVMQRIFGNGHGMHDRWKNYMIKTGALMGVWECPKTHEKFGVDQKLGVLKPGPETYIYHEVGLFDEETWWGGHVDCVIDVNLFRKYQLTFLARDGKTLPEEGNKPIPAEEQHIVVDFKSMNPMQFSKLQEPCIEHNTQMQIYLYLTGLKYGKFIYEDKATQNTKEYLVTRDDALLAVKKEEALRLRFILTHTDSQNRRVLPVRQYKERTHKECLRCKFRGHCWKD